MTIKRGGRNRESGTSGLLAVSMAACLCVAMCAVGADPNGAATTWSGDTTGSYSSMGTLDSSLIGFVSDGTSIQVSFAAQSTPPSRYLTATVIADAGVQDSLFAGDYVAAGAESVSFQIKGDAHTPSALGVVLIGKTGNRKWYNKDGMTVSSVAGQWVTNSVSLGQASFDQKSGWILYVYMYGSWMADYQKTATELEAAWREDLKDVGAIGVNLAPSGVEAQSYTIDQFRLANSGGFITPPAKLSPFQLSAIENTPQGPTIRWQCTKGAKYTVTRSQNLLGAFAPLADPNSRDMVAAETGYMTYTDTTATGEGPYFYKVMGK